MAGVVCQSLWCNQERLLKKRLMSKLDRRKTGCLDGVMYVMTLEEWGTERRLNFVEVENAIVELMAFKQKVDG